MRLCVRWLRVCAGEEKRALRKGAFCARSLTERRSLRPPRRAECVFPSHHRPGGAGPNPPPACGALWKMAQLGKRARASPPPGCGGVRQGPQAPAWDLAARKDAVWAEGLADGAPWARPGYHQAARCGLRRCRELRILAPVVTGPYGASLKLPATPGDGAAPFIT